MTARARPRRHAVQGCVVDGDGWPEYITKLEPCDLVRGVFIRYASYCTRGCLCGRIELDFSSRPPTYGYYGDGLFGLSYSPAASAFLRGVLVRLGMSQEFLDGIADLFLHRRYSPIMRSARSRAFAALASNAFEDGVGLATGKPPTDAAVCSAWNAERRARGYVVEVPR